MTTEQILREFESLPRKEQEELSRKIEARLRDGNANGTHRLTPENIEERRATAARLHGILRREGEAPNDEEIARMRDDYLMEKYG